MVTNTHVEQAWAEVLIRFGNCACRCDGKLCLSEGALELLREIFEKTIAAAIRKYGWDDWKSSGREYVLDRVCQIARIAESLAVAKGEKCIGKDTLLEAANKVVRLAKAAIERFKKRQEPQPEDDHWILFGRYCEDYEVG